MISSQFSTSEGANEPNFDDQTDASSKDHSGLITVGSGVPKQVNKVPSSSTLISDYIFSAKPPLHSVPDALTGCTVKRVGFGFDDSLTLGSMSAISAEGDIMQDPTLSHREDMNRQPVAASHDLRTVYRPVERQGPDRFDGKHARPLGKFIHPNKPKRPSPSKTAKDVRPNVARDVSKFQRALALKAASYEDAFEARHPRPKLLEYLLSFVDEECRARGIERPPSPALGSGHPEVDSGDISAVERRQRLLSLEQELGVYFEAYETFVEALDAYKTFLVPIKRKSLELVDLYRDECGSVPQLRAKVRAEAFNDHESLDRCQLEVQRLKVENKVLKGQVVASEESLKETKEELAKKTKEVIKTELQAAEMTQQMKRTNDRANQQRVADMERLKALSRSLAQLERENKQVKREAERLADQSRVSVAAAEHDKVLLELVELKRTHKVLKSKFIRYSLVCNKYSINTNSIDPVCTRRPKIGQHNKLSKKTRRLTLSAKAGVTPKGKKALCNLFDPLHSALYKQRGRDHVGGHFNDTAATISSAFESDWARVCKVGGIISFIRHHDAEVLDSRKNVDDVLGECKTILNSQYQLLLQIHQHYSSVRDIKGGNHGISSITVDPFCRFLEEIGAFQSEHCSRNACILIFTEANNEGEEEDSKTRDLNDDNALMRFEFIECLLRVAFLCHGDDVSRSVVKALQVLILENIGKSKTTDVNRRWSTSTSDFRKNVFYTDPVEKILRSRNVELKGIFEHYSRIHPIAGHGSRGNFGTSELHRMLFDAHLIQQGLVTNRTAQQCFVRSRLFVVDEVKNVLDLVALSYVNFLELICRLAAEQFDEETMDSFKLDIKAQTIETFVSELIGGLAENQQISFSTHLRSIDEWERDDAHERKDGGLNDLELTPDARYESRLPMASVAEDGAGSLDRELSAPLGASRMQMRSSLAHTPAAPPDWEIRSR